MATSPIRCFEDLIVWQKARRLTGRIYAATRQPPFNRDFGLANQIQRAAVSVMANIAEGFERNSSASYGQFLLIAKSSSAEVQSHLFIARDIGYLNEKEASEMIDGAREISKMLGALHRAVTEA